MPTLKVVNIKCGGCEKSIISALEKEGLNNIQVNISSQEVSFEGDAQKAASVLSKMGYPEASSPKGKSFLKKAKSYYSCMVGRTKA